MSNVRYDVVFYGEILAGFTEELVKEGFSKLFKMSADRVDKIFTSSRVVLKSGLDEASAQKYQSALEKIGALTVLEQQQADELTLVEPATVAPAVVAPTVAESIIAEPTRAQESSVGDTESSDVKLEPKVLKFQFHGNGSEYFKIWIVNILLSIVTLGIYSAWAKVRNKQYFYGNTEFENSTFAYLASPITILKGRLIAMAVIVFYSIANNMSIVMSLIAIAVMLLASPFFVQRSLMFNARNSAYRNVRFNFVGEFKESAVIFAAMPLVFILLLGGSAAAAAAGWPWLMLVAFVLVFGVGIPYFIYRQKDYFADNSVYGTTGFEFSASPKSFYGLWGKLLLWSVVAFFVVSILAVIISAAFGLSLAALGQGEGQDSEAAMAAIIPIIISIYVAMGIAYLFPFIYYSVRVNNLLFNNTRIDGFQLNADYELMSYGRLVLVNTLLTIITLGFYRPWAMVRTAQYKADHISVIAVQELDSFVAGEEQHVGALGDELGDFYDLDFGF